MATKRAGFLDGMRVRAQIARAALFRPSMLKSFFNPAYVSNLSQWQRVFGQTTSMWSANAWGVHGDPFAVHPLVHRAISVIHDSAMGVPIVLSRKQGQDMVPVETGVEWQALNRPSSSLSRAQLIGGTAGLLKCPMGEAFWLIVRVREARAIVLLQPEYVQPDRMADGSIVYRVRMSDSQNGEGLQRNLTEDQIIHFKTFNPGNLWRGLGALQALSDTITDDIDIQRHNRQMVRNGGLYRPVLQTDIALPEIGSPEDERLEKELEKLLGSPDSRGKVVILPNGLKVAEASRRDTDMDYGDAQLRILHKISGATGVPPAYLGQYERDQADSQAQERDLWNACVSPLLKYMADKIETDMWKLTGLSRAQDTGINVGFDWDTVPALVRQKQSLWAGDTQDIQSGIVTINEVRRRRGMPDVPWGDVWWASGLPTPISSEEAPQMQAPPVDTNADSNAADDTPPPKKSAQIIPLHRSIALDSDEMKLAGFLLLQATFEGKAARALQAVMSDLEGQVVQNIRSSFKALIAVPEVRRPTRATEVLFDMTDAAERAKKALRPSLREAQMAGGRRGLRLAKVNQSFTVNAREAAAYLNRQERRYGTDVADTTWDRLKHSLEIGLREGESEKDLTRRVERVMEVRRSDAQRTAATEVGAAANGGVALGFLQSEVVKKKRWLTAGDEHVREAHARANGQTVAVEQSFLVGGESLAFPCAPEGSSGNVYNCRCTIEPVL